MGPLELATLPVTTTGLGDDRILASPRAMSDAREVGSEGCRFPVASIVMRGAGATRPAG